MTLRRAAQISALVGILGGSEGLARATHTACSPMAVEADSAVLAQWPELPAEVRGAFSAREDIDACARVSLGMSDGAIALRVLLPDGRAASRFASQREDVVPMLEALLLVPRHPAPSEPPPPLAPLPPPPPPSIEIVSLPPVRDTVKPAPEAAPSRFGIELSALTGGRAGNDQVGAGLGASSFLRVNEWLVGLEGRIDSYGKIGGALDASVLAFALLGARRFRFGNLALDAGGGLAFVRMGNTVVETPTSRTEFLPATVPRLRVGSRLNFSARSTFRTFVGIEGEVGATGGEDAPPIRVYELPVWTMGLAFGATVGTR